MILHLARGERSVALRAELHVIDLVAPVVARGHVLGAGLDPLHRPSEPLRERQHQRLLAVGLELRAEAAAHVGGHHAQLVLGDAEHAGEHEARDVRDLGRGPQREVVAASLGHRAARLDGRARGAVVHEAVLHRDLRLGEAGVDVAASHRPLVRLVGAELLPDERRAVLERRLRVHHSGLRVVLHDHVLGGVHRDVPGRGHNHRHGIAHVLHLTALERPVLGRLDLDARRRPDHGERTREVVGHVLAREHGHHAAALLRGGRVDRGDRGVRLGRAHHHEVQHAGEVDVLGVVAPARDHPGVLLALHRRADVRGHADTSVPAAAFTASTMLW